MAIVVFHMHRRDFIERLGETAVASYIDVPYSDENRNKNRLSKMQINCRDFLHLRGVVHIDDIPYPDPTVDVLLSQDKVEFINSNVVKASTLSSQDLCPSCWRELCQVDGCIDVDEEMGRDIKIDCCANPFCLTDSYLLLVSDGRQPQHRGPPELDHDTLRHSGRR